MDFHGRLWCIARKASWFWKASRCFGKAFYRPPPTPTHTHTHRHELGNLFINTEKFSFCSSYNERRISWIQKVTTLKICSLHLHINYIIWIIDDIAIFWTGAIWHHNDVLNANETCSFQSDVGSSSHWTIHGCWFRKYWNH